MPPSSGFAACVRLRCVRASYFPKFKTEMRSIITRSLIAEGLVPEPLHQPELLSVTKQLLEQSWPTADADSETVMQACLVCGVGASCVGALASWGEAVLTIQCPARLCCAGGWPA